MHRHSYKNSQYFISRFGIIVMDAQIAEMVILKQLNNGAESGCSRLITEYEFTFKRNVLLSLLACR